MREPEQRRTCCQPCSTTERNSRGRGVPNKTKHGKFGTKNHVCVGLRYFPSIGNSLRSSSSLGCRPYSQSSKDSATFTFAAFSAPYHFSSAWRTAGLMGGSRRVASHLRRSV